MVARAGLPLQDLEFVQFHPTGAGRQQQQQQQGLEGWGQQQKGLEWWDQQQQQKGSVKSWGCQEQGQGCRVKAR